MPTRTLYRRWCKTCNEFELHSVKKLDTEERVFICECGTVYTEVYLNEIPHEKLVAQRERYKKSERNKLGMMFTTMMIQDNFSDMWSETIGRTEIVESDAGQKYIDEKRKEMYEEECKKLEEKKELQKKYSKLGRNEKCYCGSGLKFKKCCYHKIF